MMVSSDALSKNGRDINNGQFLAKLSSLKRNGVSVGNNNLINARAFLQLLERVVRENTVSGNNVHLLGTAVNDAMLGGCNKRAMTINHILPLTSP
jgi:hypothetical protein